MMVMTTFSVQLPDCGQDLTAWPVNTNIHKNIQYISTRARIDVGNSILIHISSTKTVKKSEKTFKYLDCIWCLYINNEEKRHRNCLSRERERLEMFYLGSSVCLSADY